MTKALTAAIQRRANMIRTGAPASSIAVMDARIAKLTKSTGKKTLPSSRQGGTCTVAVPSTDPMDEYKRIMAERIAVLDAKRTKIAALRAELEQAEADLDESIERFMSTAPRDDIDAAPVVVKTPVAPSAETPVPTVPTPTVKTTVETETPAPDVFESYEPTHVAAVAAGAAARWVAGPDHLWYIAARLDQIDADTGEVVVVRADGTAVVPIVGAVMAAADGVAVYAKWNEKVVAA